MTDSDQTTTKNNIKTAFVKASSGIITEGDIASVHLAGAVGRRIRRAGSINVEVSCPTTTAATTAAAAAIPQGCFAASVEVSRGLYGVMRRCP